MPKKTLFFDSFCGFVISAITENEKMTDFYFENIESDNIVGNIYKGKVVSLLKGMNAAFINCGLEKNCYLSTDDALPDASKYESNESYMPTMPELKIGDELMVQIVKPPIGKKGAKVTLFPSFIGKNIIYMPNTPFIGVSRKITDGELRKNLIYSAEKLKTENEGLVFRTVAPYARMDLLTLELNYLRNLFANTEKAFFTANVGDLLFTENMLHIRILRDTPLYDVDKIIVGNKKIEKAVNDLLKLLPPSLFRPVILYTGIKDMFEEYGLNAQIRELISPEVRLENGAELVIEQTEALTAIDVNTGKFTGDDNLEQTVYRTNLIAAREIARQVRLRNIGGIIVVDFIDMTNLSHKKSLACELERMLEKDTSKCSVAPMSKFGLIEFTRKRTGANPLSLILRTCRHCNGGIGKTPKFSLLEVRSKLLNEYSDGNKTINVDMPSELVNEVNCWKEYTYDLTTRMPDATIYFIPHKSYRDGQLSFKLNAPPPENGIKIV